MELKCCEKCGQIYMVETEHTCELTDEIKLPSEHMQLLELLPTDVQLLCKTMYNQGKIDLIQSFMDANIISDKHIQIINTELGLR